MRQSSVFSMIKVSLAGLLISGVSISSQAAVEPLLKTQWGQSDVWQSQTPKQNGNPTYPGCTTISTAQILYYFQHQKQASSTVSYVLEHDDVVGPHIDGRELSLDLTQFSYDWQSMGLTDQDATAAVKGSAEFIYHVGVTLNAQFGGDQGTSATGKQIENAFRYQWGFNAKSRRKMSIISKEAFNYSDEEWADVIRAELDAGRPVLYNGLQQSANAGHSFVIDGYRDDGKVHVNWGWGGYGNGYYDVNQLQDPSGRRWNRLPMIFRGLEPYEGRGLEIKQAQQQNETFTWVGNGSVISKTSGDMTGYGLTQDELYIPAHQKAVTSFIQWEVDQTDGTRLLIESGSNKTVSIQYGVWNDRSRDRVYKNVTLPFVLDPAKDNFSDIHGEYFVIAVIDSDTSTTAQTLEVKATTQAASNVSSQKAKPLEVDGAIWQGNGSVISYTSGTKSGYGLTQDELSIGKADKAPVIFFQWEVDKRDGKKLHLSAPKQMASITYGVWNDRSKDVTHRVELPYTIDPEADGLNIDDGSYLVIKVKFEQIPSSPTAVTAETRQ
ncbi:C10 family peptidase [Pleionea sp. CnH1-48]|uniref:C10 family peptidase n=1 Tax=Pleionea sp. CnH1-48 TaxID=2954494 RepID=UPI0020981E56|nr:C10 family peptidase [Pleionea sp. CnH1-48]MCO7223391.1 C10 family peptidase [Pleionea sp. CnH1-48]